MKQVLSVADYALILNIINKELDYIERKVPPYSILREKDKLIAKYEELLHLKNSLENLDIEVEITNIKLTEDK